MRRTQQHLESWLCPLNSDCLLNREEQGKLEDYVEESWKEVKECHAFEKLSWLIVLIQLFISLLPSIVLPKFSV